MSRTGASACRAPVSSIRRRIVAAIAVDERPGRTRPPRRSTAGSTARPRRCRPWRHSSWMIAGMPEPGLLDEVALDRVGGLGDLDRAQVGRPGEPGDLADPVGGQRPPAARRRGRPSPTTSNAQNDPSWATFSARVIRASRSRDARVERAGVGSRYGRRDRWSSLHRSRRSGRRRAGARRRGRRRAPGSSASVV